MPRKKKEKAVEPAAEAVEPMIETAKSPKASGSASCNGCAHGELAADDLSAPCATCEPNGDEAGNPTQFEARPPPAKKNFLFGDDEAPKSGQTNLDGRIIPETIKAVHEVKRYVDFQTSRFHLRTTEKAIDGHADKDDVTLRQYVLRKMRPLSTEATLSGKDFDMHASILMDALRGRGDIETEYADDD